MNLEHSCMDPSNCPMCHKEAWDAAQVASEESCSPWRFPEAVAVGELLAKLRAIRANANEASDHIGRIFLQKDKELFGEIAVAADYWIRRVDEFYSEKWAIRSANT